MFKLLLYQASLTQLTQLVYAFLIKGNNSSVYNKLFKLIQIYKSNIGLKIVVQFYDNYNIKFNLLKNYQQKIKQIFEQDKKTSHTTKTNEQILKKIVQMLVTAFSVLKHFNCNI